MNVQSSVEFISEETAEAFTTLLEGLDPDTVGDLNEFEIPTSSDELLTAAQAYEDARELVGDAPDEARELEVELNELVYSLYGLTDDAIGLVTECVDKPANPLEAKVR